MPEFSLNFEVFCSCGEGLCNQTTTRTSRHRGEPQAVVEPCQKCMESAADEAAEMRAAEVRDELTAVIDEQKEIIAALNARILEFE